MSKTIHRVKFLLAITFSIVSFIFFSTEAAANVSLDNTVFVILRHIRSEKDNKLWKRCFNSIREFYPEAKVVIIDDNSSIHASNESIDDIIVIKSEYPGAGELLPYYYFLKCKWSDKMIFLHDSMLLKRKFFDNELDHSVVFHWHFDQHQYDENEKIDELLQNLPNSDELIALNHNKSLWNGCFGVASIIDLNILELIEAEYSFTNILINKIKNRTDRMALERIFAILLFNEEFVTRKNCANFGSIFEFPGFWYPVSDQFLEDLKLTYPGAILKTWHGR